MQTFTPPPPPTVEKREKAYIVFTGPVTYQSGQNLLSQFFSLIAEGFHNIHLYLSTPGGEVPIGVTVYNTLLGLPIHLITHNVGSVDSVGTTIYLAGEERFVCKEATFGFHGVSVSSPQGLTLSHQDLLEKLESIRMDQSRLSSILQERTKLSAAECEEFAIKQQVVNPNKALSIGLSHRIEPMEIPKGSRIIYTFTQIQNPLAINHPAL